MDSRRGSFELVALGRDPVRCEASSPAAAAAAYGEQLYRETGVSPIRVAVDGRPFHVRCEITATDLSPPPPRARRRRRRLIGS